MTIREDFPYCFYSLMLNAFDSFCKLHKVIIKVAVLGSVDVLDWRGRSPGKERGLSLCSVEQQRRLPQVGAVPEQPIKAMCCSWPWATGCSLPNGFRAPLLLRYAGPHWTAGVQEASWKGRERHHLTASAKIYFSPSVPLFPVIYWVRHYD